MLYYLSQILVHKLSYLNVFHYITLRSAGAMFTALLLSIILGDRVISWLSSIQNEGQPIRSDGPESHLKKYGTPTMGGILILASTLSSALLWVDLTNQYILITLFVTYSYGFLGFLDDYKKVSLQNSKGVSGKTKMVWQLITGLVATFAISVTSGRYEPNALLLPFIKNLSIQLGVFYYIFSTIVITGSSNAVNLTDGLDGLASGIVILVTASLGLICYFIGHISFAEYLHLPYLANSGEVAVLCASIVGATLGFLWFNAPPAQIFMGDVGSLALGGAIGVISIISKQELLLLILGGVFVMEALSVIIQVASFKLRGGKRVFKMAPIHHHYEKSGWSETKVVIRFWILAIIFAIIALSSLKIR